MTTPAVKISLKATLRNRNSEAEPAVQLRLRGFCVMLFTHVGPAYSTIHVVYKMSNSTSNPVCNGGAAAPHLQGECKRKQRSFLTEPQL